MDMRKGLEQKSTESRPPPSPNVYLAVGEFLRTYSATIAAYQDCSRKQTLAYANVERL